ncbi:MAG: hypothetical protein V4584_11870 [Verrucomicrobiota bacterium]
MLRLLLLVMGRSFGMGVMSGGMLSMGSGAVVFVQLLGAIGALEFMALAGHSEQGNGHKKDGE